MRYRNLNLRTLFRKLGYPAPDLGDPEQLIESRDMCLAQPEVIPESTGTCLKIIQVTSFKLRSFKLPASSSRISLSACTIVRGASQHTATPRYQLNATSVLAHSFPMLRFITTALTKRITHTVNPARFSLGMRMRYDRRVAANIESGFDWFIRVTASQRRCRSPGRASAGC